MHPLPKKLIASHYLPSRYHYWYAFSKMAMDPIYAGIRGVFTQTRAALLDVGCGIGLLPQCLRASGVDIEYRGFDIDAGKIAIARTAALKGGLPHARFDVVDLSREFPEHRGSVALLDVMQYLEVDVRDALLAKAAGCISHDGRLIIRTGIDDRSWRAALTRGADWVGHKVRWMATPPRSQPTREELAALLTAHGLKSEFQPLSGTTPFNNWLVLGSRAD